MNSAVLLLPLAIILAGAAVAALFWLTPLRSRLSITRLAYLLTLAPLAAFVALLAMQPAISGGQSLAWSFTWIPSFGLQAGLYFDGLSALFALIVTGIGVLVVVYAGYYFKETLTLTPALSQGEREFWPPLPLGEGRGEGGSLLEVIPRIHHHQHPDAGHDQRKERAEAVEIEPGLQAQRGNPGEAPGQRLAAGDGWLHRQQGHERGQRRQRQQIGQPGDGQPAAQRGQPEECSHRSRGQDQQQWKEKRNRGHEPDQEPSKVSVSDCAASPACRCSRSSRTASTPRVSAVMGMTKASIAVL